MNSMGKNCNDKREAIVRSENDVDNTNTNTNRVFDRNTAIVRNSGNSTVNVNINIDEEDEAGVAGVADVEDASRKKRSRFC
jgi:hypothetical protein